MKYSFTLVVSILSLNSFGQDHFVGVEIGLTQTNISGDNFWDNTDNRTAISMGVSYERHLKENIQVSTGLTFLQKGFSSEIIFYDEFANPTGETGGSVSNNYNYLSIPLKIGYRAGNKVSGFANVGLAPSILLRAEVTEPAIEGFTEEKITDITNRVSTFDLVGLAELGVSYNLSKLLISTSFMYQQGIISITNEDYFDNNKIRNFGAAFLLSVKYKLN